MLLRELTAAHGVSGNENEVRALVKKLAEERGATCVIDRMGNVIATKEGPDGHAPHILLDAHMDEVGVIITGIRDDGLLRYKPVGGIDARVMVSKRVLLGDGNVPGVIGAKAIHLQSDSEMGRVLEHKDMFIDIGAKAKAEAEKLCPPGTYGVFDSPLTEFGDGCVVGRALDDRVGCLTMLRALEHGYAGKLTCAFTTQEETGLRGATVVSHYLDNDLAIALEGTSANDLGDVEVTREVCCVGKGVAVSFMDRASIAHPALRQALLDIAAARGIPCQHKRGVTGGNDAGPLQRGMGAKPTGVLSVPCRYIHSPSSVASLADIQSQADLVCALLDELPARWPGIHQEQSEEENV